MHPQPSPAVRYAPGYRLRVGPARSLSSSRLAFCRFAGSVSCRRPSVTRRLPRGLSMNTRRCCRSVGTVASIGHAAEAAEQVRQSAGQLLACRGSRLARFADRLGGAAGDVGGGTGGGVRGVGRVAALMATGSGLAPLQRRLVGVGRVLAVTAVVLCAVVLALGLLRGQPLELMVVTAISLVVAVPESLPPCRSWTCWPSAGCPASATPPSASTGSCIEAPPATAARPNPPLPRRGRPAARAR